MAKVSLKGTASVGKLSATTGRKQSCPLCVRTKLTFWHYECEMFVVFDCIKCQVPMYVWKKHGEPTQEVVDAMVTDAMSRFPGKQLDFTRRSVAGHFHFHVR
jgi:hypothetical protein